MKVYSKACLTVLALALAALVMVILATQPTHAAGPWYVGPGGSDSNTCLSPATRCATINGALNKPGFVAGDTIRVAIGTYTGTGDEVVLLSKNATLSGGWDGTFTTQSGTSTIDGQGSRRGITVNSGVTAIFERFTVQNGSSSEGSGIYNDGTLTLNNGIVSGSTASSDGDTGGVFNNSGSLILNNSTVSGNTGYHTGGGIYHNNGTLTLNNSIVSSNTSTCGGGIYNGDTMTLNNCTVSGNTASDLGGGIYNLGTLTLDNSTVSGNTGQFGGGILNSDTLTLNNSTVSGNTAGNFGGGIHTQYGSLTLNRSAVSGNRSGGVGGGISHSTGTVNMNNSTVSGNMAGDDGGGIYHVYQWSSTLTLNSSTVSGNTASDKGGGLYNFLSGTVTSRNTIVAGNTAGSDPDCSGTLGSAGYNLIGDTSGCTFTPISGDLTNIDAKLGPLQDNGGPTETHALLPGSPAIDAGDDSACPATDQRGVPRPQGGQCDIGAVEMQELDLSNKMANVSTASPGTPLTYTITLRNISDADVSNVVVTDTVPVSLTYNINSLSATAGSYGYANGVITWTGSVNASGVVTITFGATVSQTTPVGISITNSAVISGGGEIITRTAAVNVVQQVESVAISGPTTGLVQVGYPFIATVSPITATLPITYVWQATGQSLVTNTGGLSDTVTFTWSTIGTQAITVMANNSMGTPVTATHTIAVDPQRVYLPVVLKNW